VRLLFRDYVKHHSRFAHLRAEPAFTPPSCAPVIHGQHNQCAPVIDGR